MRERILKFIESEGLSAAEFADKIGVQRSSVSHVLNGRNNPGFAFIQKILEAFPLIDSRWLLTGTKQALNEKESVEKKGILPNNNNLFSTNNSASNNTVRETPTTPAPKQVQEKPEEQLVAQQQETIKSTEKKVTKVLIFYDDHTFEDFRPAK